MNKKDKMELIKVKDLFTKNEFHKVPKILYKKDKNWTCPLDIEIENIFNPEKNLCFNHGEAVRWILKNDGGNLIGRIAAFYDTTKAGKNDQPTGGFGFFECINDKKAAFLLFDTAKNWLKEKGMEAMDGPINFGENLTYWGLLIDGFIQQGYGMQYNFPYYRELFEEYGFEIFYEQYSYHDNLTVPYPERQVRFGEHIGNKPNFSFRHFELKKSEEYIRQMVDTYNSVWSNFLENYTHLEYKEFYSIFEDAKPIIKEEFIWFAYDEDKMIGFIVGFPDVNQILNKMNGKLNLWNKLKFLYYKSTKTINRCRVIVSGTLPEYQRSGIIIPLYLKISEALKKEGIKELELSWVGEYNKAVISLYDHFEAKRAKTHATYRFLFDRSKKAERFSFYLGADVKEKKK